MNSKNEKNISSKTPKNKTKYIIYKAMTRNSPWSDTEEFLDVIYWGRQILGILLGIVWGLFPLKGFVGLVLFCLVSAASVYLYAINYQAVDEEEYGGAWEIIKEGFGSSFAGFLVTWIIIYSGLHFDD